MRFRGLKRRGSEELSNAYIRKAQSEDFPNIATLIVEQNQLPEQQCIHSGVDTDAESIQREVIALDAKSEICFAMA